MRKFVRKSLLYLGLYDTVVDLKRWITQEDSKYVKFYSQFVKEGQLCFDIGANVGRRTRALLKLKVKIVAVEPQAHCMDILSKKYTNNADVFLVQKALAEKQGVAEMMISDAHSLSSLSKDWIRSVQASGRYNESNWHRIVTVPVTTLDKLIEEFGKPVFVKIDVEGYEYHVLQGLTQPVNMLSFEFTPEFMDSALNSVKQIIKISQAKFNYCLAKAPTEFTSPEWLSPEQMCKVLESLRDKLTGGDVYVKFKS